jgi:hypothetical protein
MITEFRILKLTSMQVVCMIGCSLILWGCNQFSSEPTNQKIEQIVLNNKEEIINSIQAIMNRQENAWNEGNIDQFMIGYWESDSLTFIGKSGLNYGWKKTLLNYKKSYPSPEDMGILTFNNLSTEVLSEDVALVIGKWRLNREIIGDTLEGHYSLVWKRVKNNWVIVSDHSS